MKRIFTLICGLFILTFSLNAQVEFKYLNHVFASDSLKGFDEVSAGQLALERGFFGSEYKVFMYKIKRDFINTKYGYSKPEPFGANAKGPSPSVLTAPCVNEDFEASASSTSTVVGTGSIGNTLAGWTVTQGQNSGVNASCTQAGCCPTVGSTNAWVRTTPWTDPNAGVLGVIPASPLGGTKILQMNDNIPVQGEMVRLQQTFPVTSTNALFQLAFMASLNGSSHLCCDQPYLKIEVIDCSNNVLACPSLSITPPGSSCVSSIPTGWVTNTAGISYTPLWKQFSIDLTPYMGTCVTIRITVSDCDGWAHHGMCYVDMVCTPMTITAANIPFPAGTPVVAVTACGVVTASLVAPPGMGPYLWNGPGGSGVTSNTNQSVSTSMAGNYTLTMNPPGICAPITKTVSLTFGSFPLAGFTRTNTCTVYTLQNTGTGAPAVQTYSFVGSGAPPSYTTTANTSVVIFAPSTTYTIYQVVTNAAGCPATSSVVITTPAGPNPAFNALPSFTQCITGNSFNFNATTAAGTHTYAFMPAAGAPASGFVANYGAVNFTAPGTYTVTHTINNGAGCISSTSSLVTIAASPTIAASGIAPPCAGAQATLTGSGGPGVLTWTGPSSFTAVGGNAFINNFQTTNQGVYTLTANNNGCIVTKTVSMTMGSQPTATITNGGPYCQGATITLSAQVSTTVGISFTQFYPNSWCCWSTCCTGYSAAVTPTATTSSSGIYYFYVGYTNGCWAQVQTSVTVNPCVLPIEMTSFGATCSLNAIQLNWETASELNNDHFILMRSEDGIHFDQIVVIPGHGTSYGPNKYQYFDKAIEPEKVYYYKLIQVDYDRTEHLSDRIIYAQCGGNSSDPNVEVYPVPADNEVFVLSNKDMPNATIEIISALGEKIKQINNVNLSKNQKFKFNVRDLPDGYYHLIISSEGIKIQKRIITSK
jgi:hypothetical protein